MEFSERVTEMFIRFADLTPEEGVEWQPVVEAAIGEVSRMLPGEIAPEDEARVVLACAAVAYYQYCLIAKNEAVDVKLGDLSVSQTGDYLKTAERIREAFLNGIRDLTQDQTFVFRGIGERCERL